MANGSATRFIITCPARTGSSMLTSLLQSHPDVCCHGEVFGRRVFEGFQGIDYTGPISETLKPPIVDKLVELRIDDPVAFLRDYVLYPGQFKAIGLKLKYEELLLDMYAPVLEWISDKRDIKIIHLRRRNLLKRYVSQYIAVKITKVFNTWEGTDAPCAPRVTLSAQECERQFQIAENRHKRFANLFKNHEVLDLTYENLVANKMENLIDIQTFLGVNPVRLSTGMKKINPDSLRSMIENYDQLARHFSGTRFEAFFE
jgi:LPS sulfotransferase NodH